MKYLLTPLLLLCVSLCVVHAQADPIRSFFNQYKQLDEAEEINLGGFLLDLVAAHADDDEAATMLRKIKRLRMLTVSNPALIDPAQLLALRQAVKANQFEELIQVRDGVDHVDILLRETPDAITDVLLLIQEPDSFVLISLEGLLRYDDLRNLELDIDGLNNLDKLPPTRAELP